VNKSYLAIIAFVVFSVKKCLNHLSI